MTIRKSDPNSIEYCDEGVQQKNLDVSLVIPLYNEMGNVKPLHQAICSSLDASGYSFEIVFVDDGSDDATLQDLAEVLSLDQRARALRLRRNFGQTAAMQVGIAHARGKTIVTLDGDQQNDPSDIPTLLSRIDEGNDLVTGWRKDRKDRLLSRKIPSRVANWCIARFLGITTHDLGCTLKAYRASLIHEIPLYSDLHRFIPAVCSMASTRIDEVVVSHHPRRIGKTKYGIFRTWRVLLDALTVKMLLSCAHRPLHWFGYWSIAAFMLAGVASIGSLVLTLQSSGNSAYVGPGITILLGYLGLQLLFSGIFAEIVVRTEPKERVRALRDVTILTPLSDR